MYFSIYFGKLWSLLRMWQKRLVVTGQGYGAFRGLPPKESDLVCFECVSVGLGPFLVLILSSPPTPQDRRGKQQNLLYLDCSRVLLKYKLPLSEVVVDFFDQVKSLSSGYARYGWLTVPIHSQKG